MNIESKLKKRQLYCRIIFVLIFVILVAAVIISTQYKLKQNTYALGIEAVSGFSAKAEYTINAYHVAIDFASIYIENLVKRGADKDKLYKWLTTFNNNLSKNVSNNSTHSYIIINNEVYCSSHHHTPLNKMSINNIWYKDAVNAEYDKIYFTKLYQDDFTKEYVFTIYKKIKVQDDVVIMASDIIVDTLQKEWFKDNSKKDNNIYILTNFVGDVVFTTYDMEKVINSQNYFYDIINEINKRNIKIGFLEDKYSSPQKYVLFYLLEKNNHFVSMVAVPVSEINGSSNSLFMEYFLIILALALVMSALYWKEKNSIEKITLSNDIINIVGSAYYLIFSINIKKDRYTVIKSNEEVERYVPAEGKYSDLHKLVAMIVEKGAQLDFNSSFSIENIRKLTEEDKVDFGGDFQRILIEGYKWINIRLLYDKSIQKDYAVLCFKERDIEKKRELEHIKLLEESVEAMKDASVSKSMFYSGLSHDMRTPLNAIIGLTDLVEYHIKDEEKIKDYMDKMKFAGNQLITLIDNFLDYSKNEFEKVDTEVTNFNLKEYLSELVNVFKLVAKNDGKKFIYNYNVKHNNLKGNTAKLYRIITNLLGNSFKYSRQNDTITFDVKEITSQGCPKFQFIISDTGIGMSEEFINKVCSPYQREKRFDTNKAGVGLGMAIVKNYVQYLNGDMQIESKLNEGTKITVTLAFEYSDEEIKDEEEQENIQYDISGLSILVVEDNNVNMYLVTELLSIHNVKVTQAWNGKEAVDIFESNPPHTFDVILMDLQMPVMDGIEAAKTIRHIQRKDAAEIPIIALSANVYTEDVAASSAAGMNGHLSKPINFDALCKAIYHALKNKY